MLPLFFAFGMIFEIFDSGVNLILAFGLGSWVWSGVASLAGRGGVYSGVGRGWGVGVIMISRHFVNCLEEFLGYPSLQSVEFNSQDTG